MSWRCLLSVLLFFFFLMIRRPPRSTLFSLHDALPIWRWPSASATVSRRSRRPGAASASCRRERRSEEHTSELQSHLNLVCRLLLEKKKKQTNTTKHTNKEKNNSEKE